MWYAILLASGILLGLGLMIWALRERKLRFLAESKVKDLEVSYKQCEVVAKNNKVSAERVGDDLVRCKETNDLLYVELTKARDLLIKYADTAAIKDWLLSELNKKP